MTPSTWAWVALPTCYFALHGSAWIGRTVGPWFLVFLALGALVFPVAYLVVGDLRDRRKPWVETWWCQR